MITNTQKQDFGLFIEGKTAPSLSGQYFDCVNPSNGEVFARWADADAVDVEIAVNAARLAFDHGRWPQMATVERGKFLLRIAQLIRENAKELADLECWSTGKTIKHATFIDVPTCADTFEYFGNFETPFNNETIEIPSPHLCLVSREPVGVVAAIIPWNYPLITDRKSTRLNSSHRSISYAVFSLKKKDNHDYLRQHFDRAPPLPFRFECGVPA